MGFIQFGGDSPSGSVALLQEAVHNALKYSGTGDCDVSLTGTATAIQLIVRDSGAGFDPGNLKGQGLGLISMRERLRLVKGQLSIESRPGHGTTIRATVPVESGAVTAVTA